MTEIIIEKMEGRKLEREMSKIGEDKIIKLMRMNRKERERMEERNVKYERVREK